MCVWKLACYTLCIVVVQMARSANSQTSCSIRVPVPGMDYCDAVGALEQTTDTRVHETRGRIHGMQDYQDDTFKLFDQQFTEMINKTTYSDAEVKDIEEELATLKRVLDTLQTMQTAITGNTGSTNNTSRRSKRALTSLPPGQQQQLDKAKLSFQQSLADVLQKIQNISKTLSDDAANAATFHAHLQQELVKNQRGLTIVEQLIIKADAELTAAAVARQNSCKCSSMLLFVSVFKRTHTQRCVQCPCNILDER